MNAADVHALYAYNRWANARVLDSCSKLAREPFVKSIPSSFPSVRDTLAHVLGAEWIWLERWKGVSPKALLDPATFPALAPLRERWKAVEAEQKGFVEALTDADLARPLTYVNTKSETWTYPLGRTLQHVVNHSTYHRGQVTTMLRQLGALPLPTDLLVFEDEMAAG
jgi:uncharacterized damage-inducible protein DinB